MDISLEEEVGVYALGPGPLPLHYLQDTAQVTKALNPKSRQVLINRKKQVAQIGAWKCNFRPFRKLRQNDQPINQPTDQPTDRRT